MQNTGMPKICYILPSYDSATGSHFFHLYEFLEAIEKEMDVFVVVERCAAAPPFQKHYCQRFAFIPMRFFELVFVFIRERFRGRRDFYIHYSFLGALAAWLVTRIFGGRVYYWNSGMPWLYRRPWFEEVLFRFILRHTILVTDPPGLAEEYRRRYGLRPEHIRIVPHFISVKRFQASRDSREMARRRLGIPPGTGVILFLHRLSRRKGAHLIPDIAAKVTKRNKNVMFLVAGTGPEEQNLKLETHNLKLEPQVRFLGEVPQREVPQYLAAADVCINPSEEEGFPHALLEAMAAGVPYVASDVGGVREVTLPELQSHLILSDNAGMYAEEILKMLRLSSPERQALSQAELSWVQRYDLNRTITGFSELFR